MLIPGALRTGLSLTNPTWKLEGAIVMEIRWAHFPVYTQSGHLGQKRDPVWPVIFNT